MYLRILTVVALCFANFLIGTGIDHEVPAPPYISQNILTYTEYHSVCPLVGIGTLPPLSRRRVCPPLNHRMGAHSPAGEGSGSPNADD